MELESDQGQISEECNTLKMGKGRETDKGDKKEQPEK